MSDKYKFELTEADLPKAWYNINPDMPVDPAKTAWNAVLHPGTLEPVTPDFLSVLFPMRFIGEAMSLERWVEIPEPVREIYKLWRPSPLHRAHRLEKALDTPAHIYYKYEGVSPVGSHKSNTAIAQAFYAKEEGVKGFTTETGAGQWGSAMSMACSFFNLECHVYMVKVSYNQKPYRRIIMENFGATVTPSPSDKTEYGRKVLAENPNSPGSLGIAISEGVEAAVASNGKYKYCLGSVLGPVLMHQTVIGLEALKQFDMAGEYPDMVIACAGGGSNFAGFTFPFIHKNLTEGQKTRVIAVEPAACPSLTKGKYTFDYGDTARMAPVVKMHTLGHGFMPDGIHAGGLRYHGMAPHVSALVDSGHIEAIALDQLETFEGARMFAQAEGIVPAPESSHAVRAAINEAVKCKEEGKKKVIAFNLSGHGLFDLGAYDEYLKGNLKSTSGYSETKVEEAMKDLPQVAL
ncbi:MAG: TrpB-like pyridoxal phosphate-dependent enzyme [Chloroflexi bacterium]|nr:TrpB-like pyridoxal phosphate-dependent enzyme [Chloroflexi bacterium CFX1]MCK6568984.1 TrpB-like pyridoxal phosphate-dependent enzyme [Anaerolineales bacterium]MCQ3952340.1 TrpB-like pyridoxal phosphate-dependent enzyme [Chloroflexota bacterium]MDL1917839.1 TrpB-like pyridoxal phosphate-dependent enzyme [Chloroflexi bacterium CFX5]NUQ58049.1 TrpB-like pyridoxal phosphate-dependent enzyme [Anaerolineales bacterium]